jgi:hypothetical protein
VPENYPEFSRYIREIVDIRTQVRRFFNKGTFRDEMEADVCASGCNILFTSYSLCLDRLIVVVNKENRGVKVKVNIGGKRNLHPGDKVIIREPFRKPRLAPISQILQVSIKPQRFIAIEVKRAFLEEPYAGRLRLPFREWESNGRCCRPREEL